jgi:hypothetical protein
VSVECYIRRMDAWKTRLASQRQELLDNDDEDDLALRIKA